MIQPTLQPIDSTYLGGFSGGIAENAKKRLSMTCIEMLDDAFATSGRFDGTSSSPYVQQSEGQNTPRSETKCDRGLSLVRWPATFDGNQCVYIAVPKNKNRDMSLGKISKTLK